MINKDTLYCELATATPCCSVTLRGNTFSRDEFINLFDAYTRALYKYPHHSIFDSNRRIKHFSASKFLKNLHNMPLIDIYDDWLNYINYQFQLTNVTV